MEKVKKGLAALLLAVIALGCCVAIGLICGCMSENTGVSASVGDITTLPEISDASDNITIKILLMMTGAKVWTAKDSNVTVDYRNCYTNDYIGIFHTRGTQDLRVTVEPVEVGGGAVTNGVEVAE